MSDSDLIVMAAPNGARKTKRDHPNLPITPDEIAAEAKRCVAAGAAVVHIHVRDEAGMHSLDPGRYREAVAAIQDLTGDQVIIQITSEAVDTYTPDAQIAAVKAVKPEAVSVALREICPTHDDEAAAFAFFRWMKDEGVWPQFILYDAADAERFKAMMNAAHIPFAHPYCLYVLGRYTPGQISAPADLDPFLAAMADAPPHRWAVCAFGRGEAACVKQALLRGGDVRVGFENNVMMPDGARANTTSDLVGLAREAGLAAGRRRLDAAAVRAKISEWIG